MRVLVIAPHPDDESLGMGATIAKHIAAGDEVTVALMTGAGPGGDHPIFPADAFATVRREFDAAMKSLRVANTIVRDLPTVLLDGLPTHEVNAATKSVVEAAQPERLYVPFPYDLHRDHRELFYSLSVHWRPYLEMGQSIREVYCYETPSETHLAAPYLEPAFSPNVYVDVSAYLQCKLDALRCYESQIQPSPLPRSLEAVEALAKYRGSQIGVRAAEAFVLVRKLDI